MVISYRWARGLQIDEILESDEEEITSGARSADVVEC